MARRAPPLYNARMSKSAKNKAPDPTIAVNRRAHHDYFIEDRFEAGLALEGWEVKSLRAGRVSLQEAYVILRNGEAWLIGWPPGTGTGWHDHADSVGAFMTASGELKENSLAVRLPTDGWTTLELTEGVDRERRLATGQGRAFGRHHVHEVLNESTDRHAVSVHAYYPPLPRIRRYSRTGPTLRLEQVERPEDWQ